MLNSQLEIVQQAVDFLSSVDQNDYIEVCKPHLAGSIGAHMRHIIDHYLALQEGVELGHVDYNKRHRQSPVAESIDAALAAWQDIARWLEQACNKPMESQLTVVSEVSLSCTDSVEVTSTLARELLFVSSHAIHHFSLLAVARSLQGAETDKAFGIAPATASFMRQQA